MAYRSHRLSCSQYSLWLCVILEHCHTETQRHGDSPVVALPRDRRPRWSRLQGLPDARASGYTAAGITSAEAAAWKCAVSTEKEQTDVGTAIHL